MNKELVARMDGLFRSLMDSRTPGHGREYESIHKAARISRSFDGEELLAYREAVIRHAEDCASKYYYSALLTIEEMGDASCSSRLLKSATRQSASLECKFETLLILLKLKCREAVQPSVDLFKNHWPNDELIPVINLLPYMVGVDFRLGTSLVAQYFADHPEELYFDDEEPSEFVRLMQLIPINLPEAVSEIDSTLRVRDAGLSRRFLEACKRFFSDPSTVIFSGDKDKLGHEDKQRAYQVAVSRM